MASQQSETEVEIIGAQRHPFRDLYHGLLRLPWGYTLGLIVSVYLTINALFAVGYWLIDGVGGARHGSFVDAFFFSVQTMGTIGYGSMYPTSLAANVLVVAESVLGLIIVALATGLVFAKFSNSTAQIVFTRQITIAPWNRIPTLSFRVGNDRSNTVADAQVRVAMVQTEITAEGVTFYRMTDLVLTRDRSPAMSRSWTVQHPIDAKSPLFGLDPAAFEKLEIEFMATIVGTDDTSLQPVHARMRWEHQDVLWGARHVDVLTERPDGRLVLDVTRFHETVPTVATAEFPYPRQ
jgi:inward rectifier potassium channel